jgi:hypothetical protein
MMLLVLAVAVSACGGTAATPTPGAGTLLGEDYEDALSLRNQLLLGTLRLQGTPDQLSVEQARTLLPLWQAFKVLSASETSAPEETAAVLEQIHSALTQPQASAIAALRLTNADLTAWYAEQGIVQSAPEPGVTPSGGSGGGKSGDLTQEQREATRTAAMAAVTPIASGGASGAGSSRSTILVDSVIETLEELVAK